MPPKRKTRKDFLKLQSKALSNNEYGWSVVKQEKELRDLLMLDENKWSQEKASVRAGISLSIRGCYLATEGAYLCFDSIDDGWYMLKKSILYRILTNYITYYNWKTNPGNNRWIRASSSIATNLATLGSVISSKESNWLLSKINESVDIKNGTGYISYQTTDYYLNFVVRFYRMIEGLPNFCKSIPDLQKWREPYSLIFDCLNDSEKLASAIYNICEYHMIANNCDWDGHDAEFGDLPYCVNPVEIHYLEYVLKRLGVPFPLVEHELLVPPFYPIPDSVLQVTTKQIMDDDPLLKEVYQRVCQNKEFLNITQIPQYFS